MSKHRSHHTSDGHGRHKPPPPPAFLNNAVLALTAVGFLLTAYLGYTASVHVQPAFCGEDSGCDLVQSSRWAMFLGIPMAFWGTLTYLVMAGLTWRARSKPGGATALVFVAVGGFAISAYLTVISVTVIQATCVYCLTSFGLITAIMLLAFAQRPTNWTTSAKEASVVALLIVGVLHMHYSGIFDEAAGPEDPQLKSLAIHLTETGAVFYGAHWCPRCQEQKDLFKASAKRLPYVECSTGGPGSAITAPCVANDIRHYPTWIIDDKRITGVQSPRVLAANSDFDWNP